MLGSTRTRTRASPRRPSQATGKGEGLATLGGLLELEKRYETYPDRLPLLVSEGTATPKCAAISDRDLFFALQELGCDTSDLVVLGSSFGPSGGQNIEAIGRARRRTIAVPV